jgi:RHS repeat-associated protein
MSSAGHAAGIFSLVAMSGSGRIRAYRRVTHRAGFRSARCAHLLSLPRGKVNTRMRPLLPRALSRERPRNSRVHFVAPNPCALDFRARSRKPLFNYGEGGAPIGRTIAAVIPATKEGSYAPDPGLLSLAALSQLAENSHPAHQLPTALLYLGFNFASPLMTIGLSDPLYDFRGGSRCSSKERDAETGLDAFGFRYMSAAQGRFTSPDAPLLGQDQSDPQSWNLYTYARNNPKRYLDPDGHSVQVCIETCNS